MTRGRRPTKSWTIESIDASRDALFAKADTGVPAVLPAVDGPTS